MTDDAWSNFIASINPAQLESERMRVHGDVMVERFGSRQHWEMVHAHEWLKQQRAERAAVTVQEAERLGRVKQIADADLAIRQHATPIRNNEDEQLEAAIAAYRARKRAA